MALEPPYPAAQAHLSVGQADNSLTPIQMLTAVACAERDRMSVVLASSLGTPPHAS
jgi:hypothetical protein